MYTLFGGWLKSVKTPFARITKLDIQKPGQFNVSYVENGNVPGTKNWRKIPDTVKYQGRVVILVNKETISRTEYTAMAFSSIPGAKVIGSRTAGADGDVSRVPLPGGIETYISGIGVYYHDDTQTQVIGLRIDIPVEPTLQSVKAGTDEIFDKAIEVLMKK